MANKVPMEFSPFVGPDSLRAVTHLMKVLFENHTPRNYGYEDIEGSYYEGTVENWGAESLSEARKLLLDKPSLKNILIENTFEYYFDVKYSGFVNTYDQQNMLCALLKKDVLLSNKTYRLKFEDAINFNVPRASSDGDPYIIKDNFIMTLTPPKLLEESEGVTTEHDLHLTDKSGVRTVYFFHADVETEDFIGEITEGTMITKPIDDSMNGYPMIWMCVDELRTLPDVGFEGNEYGEDEKPFLTIGTNGNDISMVYTFLSLTHEELDVNKIAIKLLPSNQNSFVIISDDIPDEDNPNYQVDVYEIHLLVYDEDITDENIYSKIGTQPMTDYVITYNTTDTMLTIMNGLPWHYKYPVPGDYDYDGTTYVNRTYAYIPAMVFGNNQYDGEPLPIFKLHMSESYEYPDEYLSLNTYAGIHVDTTSDYSDNGVIKKNGTIHNLGDYDGLPPYFKYNLSKVLHRAHVEMYTLRDRKNMINQHAMDKPTAAVIVDSAVPQTELGDIENNLPITIRFDRSDTVERHFRWYDPPLSKYNVVSEITYDSMYHFGNARMANQENKKKLVYHGNRHFSLKKMGFDPELEYGRVYIISNDPCVYENNSTSENPKAPATFARICDIPTDYHQLRSIHNLAPTFIFDPEYIRMGVSYTGNDVEALINQTKVDRIIHNGNIHVFDYDTKSQTASAYTSHFVKWENFVPSIRINGNTNITWEVISTGASGYAVDDLFDFDIGGISVKGKIETVDQGEPLSVLYMNDMSHTYTATTPVLGYDIVKLSNLDGNDTLFATNAKSGSGTGLLIRMLIDPTEYSHLVRNQDGYLDNTIFFYKDDYGNIDIYYRYQSTYEFGEQVTGDIEYFNDYSYDNNRVGKVDTADSMLNTYINNNFTSMSEDRIDVFRKYTSNISINDDIYGSKDWSPELNVDRDNFQDTYMILDNTSTGFHSAVIGFSVCDSNDCFEYPDFSDVNVAYYTRKACCFKTETNNDSQQPTVWVFDPYMDKMHDLSCVAKDMYSTTTRPMTYLNTFIDNQYTTKKVVDHGYLQMNVYAYNEYDTSAHDSYRNDLNELDRDALIDIIRDINIHALPLSFESDDSPYKYTKEMLIDYIMENRYYWGPGEVSYTVGPNTIYRKASTKLFGPKGQRVLDENDNPIPDVKQPTGGMLPISIETFNPSCQLGSRNASFIPTFIFEIDGIESPSELDGFWMKDENGNDISTETILVINAALYVANITHNTETNTDEISWIHVYKQRRND